MTSSTLIKFVVVGLAAVLLSGCVVYVSPDKHTYKRTPAASDEKPAKTVDKTAA